VQRIPADEFAPKKLTLQLDLEKPSLGDEKSPSERRQPQPPQLQQQKPSKSEVKHEKSVTLVQSRDYQQLVFIPWMSSQGLLAGYRYVFSCQSPVDLWLSAFVFSPSKSYRLLYCSMLRCFHRQHAQSDVLHIATLHNLSSTNSELQR
jgi:hypothetical protein